MVTAMINRRRLFVDAMSSINMMSMWLVVVGMVLFGLGHFLSKKFPQNLRTPREAVSQIKSGEHLYIHGVAAFPRPIMQALADRAEDLTAVQLYHLHLEIDNPCSPPSIASSDPDKTHPLHRAFFVNNLFTGANQRAAVANGHAAYLPVFLSEIPGLFRKHQIPLDWTILNVSPPDRHGFVSLGVEVSASMPAAECSRKIIAMINPNMPRTHGNTHLHISAIDILVDAPELAEPLPESITKSDGNSDVERRIGEIIAHNLVRDGATLQMGIGAIPNAVLAQLKNHKNLGIHTEMFSDGVIELMERNVVTNLKKAFLPGRIVTSFVMGSRRVYDYVDDNPEVSFIDSSIANNPVIIGSNPMMTAINSAVEVDITGQVCADSIGTRLISGVGGQTDFERGAALSEGGVPIIALPATAKPHKPAPGDAEQPATVSRIVSTLKPGAGITTTRYHAHHIVTEWGHTNLHGRNMRERAREMIKIAHPEHREKLAREAYERFKFVL
ncbi:4-hydroxybutyrate CoA-transferase [Jimgerdemannia flammicorona]|uniref:4-hydroxybutyrate CoA-transferase n=1 Tax=Jimgerdemannia flammicorona TaxID=994334 RepID=A0A433QZ07_9FUNG|nr:4-hydroxybutyrate CoA-transferase [Jimgerdemannia flammicorona]